MIFFTVNPLDDAAMFNEHHRTSDHREMIECIHDKCQYPDFEMIYIDGEGHLHKSNIDEYLTWLNSQLMDDEGGDQIYTEIKNSIQKQLK